MDKYKVIISPDPLSEQEIQKHKDFAGLLQNHKTALFHQQLWRAGLSFLSVAGLVGVLLYLNPGLWGTMDNQPQPAQSQALVHQEVGSEAAIAPIPAATDRQQATGYGVGELLKAPVADGSVAAAPRKAKPAAPSQPEATGSVTAGTLVPATTKDSPSTGQLPEPIAQPELAVFTQPEPTIGLKGLQEFFAKEMQRPAGTEGLQGTVLVSFVVNEQGKPEAIEIEKGLQDALDAEALRLVRQMPLWKPATANGKPVNTRIAVPVRF